MFNTKPILLAGSGRSGTTWAGNIIAANPNVQIKFEPYYKRKVEGAKELNLINYERAGDSNAYLYNLTSAILSGKVENSWVDQQKKRTNFLARRTLVKAVRANLMLGWISENFDIDVIYMLRHPCSVISSRMKLGWTTSLSHFTSQEKLVEDHLHPYLNFIHDAPQDDEITQQAIVWCLENIVPLKKMGGQSWQVLTYEELLTSTESEAKKLLSFLNIYPTWLTRKAIKQASMVTSPTSAVRSGRNPLTYWQSEMSAEDTLKVLNILKFFEIGIYSDQPMPCR